MAKTVKPEQASTSPDGDRIDESVATEIDADEFEAAKHDPLVKELGQRADETLRKLREQGRFR